MIKTRAWPVRATYMLLAAALVISLIITSGPARMSAADEVKAEWERVGTPTVDGWVLAPESMIIDYAVASEGEVAYAIVHQDYDCEDIRLAQNGDNDEDGPFFLLKSDDHAATWKDITDDDWDWYEYIPALVATDGVDPDFVAVALLTEPDFNGNNGNNITNGESVYVAISTDGGTTFGDLKKVDEGGVSLEIPYVLRVSPEVAGKREIAIGGIDNCYMGAIFRSTVTDGVAGAWKDARYDGWDDILDMEAAALPDDLISEAVVDIQFSPNWATDWTVLAVSITGFGDSETVHLQSGSWGASGWNQKSTLGIKAVPVLEGVDIPFELYRGIAGMALPSDYNSKTTATRVLWVWVNYLDNGQARNQIRRVANADAGTAGPMSELEGGKAWLTNISYVGTIASGKAIAGLLGSGQAADDCWPELADCCEGVQVYRNDGIANMIICCDPWTSSCKPPTGRLAMAVTYVTPNKAYAVALYGFLPYDEGAWSFSLDDGDTWNQLSLIDTHIDYLSDVAVSPDCNKTMLVTVNLLDMSEVCDCEDCTGCDSVWLHAVNLPEAPEYSGQWIRTWCGMLVGENTDTDYFAHAPERGLLRLAPEETTGDTVYLVDRMSGNVYRNELEGLACWDRIASTEVTKIVDLAVRDADTVYALNENGKVAMFDGDTWQKAVDGKVDEGWTIAVHGDDILVGGRDGDVAYSDDAGETFTALAEKTKIRGFVTVAFDSYFDQNDVVYAAIARYPEGDGGIYLWFIGESTRWIDLMAKDYFYTGLVLDNADGNPMTGPATGGVLYASYVGQSEVNGDWYETGVARTLTPLMEADECIECPADWDYLVVGLDGYEYFDAMPQALKICGCLTPDTYTKLFAIDWGCYDMCEGEFGTVWTFEDCYSKQGVELRDPASGFLVPADPCECHAAPFTIEWDRLCDACVYEIQIASDPDFIYMVATIWSDEAPADNPHQIISNANVTLLPGQTYYWRVRTIVAGTGQEIRSWWSDARMFLVAPVYGTGVQIIAPAIGATGVPVTNIAFAWESITPVDEFDFELSASASFDPTVDTAQGLTDTAYTYTGAALAYETPYYWRVTGIKEGAPVSQATGTFTTRAKAQYCSPQSGLCFDTEAELRAHHEELQKVVTPVWVWVVIAIGAVLVIVVIVLIFRTRRV